MRKLPKLNPPQKTKFKGIDLKKVYALLVEAYAQSQQLNRVPDQRQQIKRVSDWRKQYGQASI